MERAGLAVARLLLAIAPHAKSIWIPCGPGNNGGDGLVAARHLQHWGKSPVVTLLQGGTAQPTDARVALEKATAAGVRFQDDMPTRFDACIDATFGIGSLRPITGKAAAWVQHINQSGMPVVSVDVPSGLHADSGVAAATHVRASATLSLLTLKPGLFTADGRDASGEIWFNTLGVDASKNASAQLNGIPNPLKRPHNSHKGSFGDVTVIGGAPGMAGAALLAGGAALHGGAGRVFVILLDPDAPLLDPTQPDLMVRKFNGVDLQTQTVVAGCGGGIAIGNHVDNILQTARQLVLDADALNAVAAPPSFQTRVRSRLPCSTVMTPHPLEAARLLGCSTAEVQAHRLESAQTLAHRFQCTVVLKGSGTIIADGEHIPRINAMGNARLATAGTGDVLAGLIGARLANGANAFEAACSAVFHHGKVADKWPADNHLTARRLIEAL
jgi:hydroxyethylthiazole kinase-like uncharacterized protein yjeF